MTQEDLDVLEGFAAVWERVSGQRLEETQGTSSAAWEEILDGLELQRQGCRRLGMWASGSHKMRLIKLAQEAERLLRQVQTEYFLDTGDIYVSELVCNFASYTPYNLRKLCKNAVNLAGLLQKAAADCSLPVEDAWKQVSGHAAALKRLLEECLQ